MKSKRFWYIQFLLLILQFSVVSCGLIGTDAGDLVDQLGIDERYFFSLPTCEQVRIYSYLGPYFPGVRVHDVGPLPWMSQIFYDNPRDAAPCIIKEGLLRAADRNSSENELRIVALNHLIDRMQASYIVTNGKLGADFNFQEAQEYLYQVVCTGAFFEPEATRALYMVKFRSIPKPGGTPDIHPQTIEGVRQMKSLLCI